MKDLTVQELIDELQKVKDKSKWIYPPVYKVEESFEFDENKEDSGTIVICNLKGKP